MDKDPFAEQVRHDPELEQITIVGPMAPFVAAAEVVRAAIHWDAAYVRTFGVDEHVAYDGYVYADTALHRAVVAYQIACAVAKAEREGKADDGGVRSEQDPAHRG